MYNPYPSFLNKPKSEVEILTSLNTQLNEALSFYRTKVRELESELAIAKMQSSLKASLDLKPLDLSQLSTLSLSTAPLAAIGTSQITNWASAINPLR
jgi:hypothetical protein